VPAQFEDWQRNAANTENLLKPTPLPLVQALNGTNTEAGVYLAIWKSLIA